MPITYDKNDRRKLITITLVDPFVYTEFLDLVDRQWIDGAWDYALLYDSRGKREAATVDEMHALVDRVHAVGKGQPRGQVGLFVPLSGPCYAAGVLLARLARDGGGIEVMLTDEQRDSWLRREAPLRAAASTPVQRAATDRG